LAYGVGATVELPTPRLPIVTALSVAPSARAGGADHLWIALQDGGVLEIAADGTRRQHLVGAAGARGTVTTLRRDLVSPPAVTPVGDTTLIALLVGVPWRQRDGQFERFDAGLDGATVADVRRVRLPNGISALVAVTDRGVRQWTGSAWEAVPGLDGQAVTSILAGSERGAPVLYLGGAHTVRTYGRAGMRVDTLPASPAGTTGQGNVMRICRTTAQGRSRVFALDSERGIYWRDEDAAQSWRLLPSNAVVPLANLGVLTMRCLDQGELAVSSFSGVSIFNVSSPDTTAWTLRSQLSDADGLPSISVGQIEPGSQGTLWIGTPYGIGVVNRERAAAMPTARVVLHLMLGASGQPIAEGAVVPSDQDDIHVDPQLLTFHREEATRFRVQMVRHRPWHFGGGQYELGSPEPVVVNAASRMYHDLAPGQYDVRVWGYDWAGRAYGPVEQHFSIDTPLGLRWYAFIAYLLVVGGVLATMYRIRVTAIRRASAGLLASERRARDSERQFRVLFEQALDAHLLVAGDRVQAANAEAARLFGVTEANALVGQALPSLLGDAPAVCVSGEHHVRRGDLLVPVQCTVTDVPTDDAVLQHVVLRDLTDVRRAEAERAWFEAQVREAQKLESLGTLAGGVAHDFNNLLGVIRGNTELARGAQRKGRSTEEHLAAILDASDRARDIVKQILTFSRRSTPTREYINLSALIVDLQPLLRRMVPRTVSLRVEGTDAVQLVMGDPTQLQQLLLNLVSNADYAMRGRTDGLLTISLQAATIPEGQPAPVGDVVELRVSDNGEGMAEDVRERIFEPFFTTKPTGEGTGLGMAVVHGIVLSHEGRAEVVSTPGAGTTFAMRFPRATIDGLFDDELLDDDSLDIYADHADVGVTENLMLGTPPSGTPMPSSALDDGAPDRFAGTTIVVVDDEPTVARVVERALEQYGHVVRVFLTPEPALSYIREHVHSVDLLITDQTMPGMTGDELTEAVKSLRANLPVLILTGYSHRLTAERVAAVRARAVLLKPVELDVLKRAVDDALSAGAPT
jgi:signal transduction histidine kinase/CheY-like chemotaxis protein